MNIRLGSLSDLTVIADHNCAMAMETENRELPRSTIEAGLRAVLKDPQKGFYLVAEDEKGVFANLMITFEWSDWRNASMWWFQSVYIKPEYRGKKVFSKMYAEIMLRAEALGVKELRLYVEKENVHAQEVYQALGMKESHYLMYEVNVGVEL